MAFKHYSWLLLSCLFSVSFTELHHGSQVWQIRSSARGLQWLQKMEKRLTDDYKVDFWKFPKTTHQPIDVMIPSNFQAKFSNLLKKYNMTYSVMIDDVGALLKKHEMQMNERRTYNLTVDFDYHDYHPYHEIRHWVRDFAAEWSPLVSEFIAGRSYEGRQIAGLKISHPSKKEKRSVWIQGGIHSNFWVSPAIVVFIAKQIVEDFSNGDPTISKILERYDIYILPLINNDGYFATWHGDRFWRKTRSPNLGSLCMGTDANRNYPYHWGEEGSQTNQCDEMYRGDSAMSEVEIQSVVEFLLARKEEQEFDVFLDVGKNYGKRWLAPWGFKMDPTAFAEEQAELGEMIIAAVNSVDGQTYTFGVVAHSEQSLNPGMAVDWGFAELGALFSYAVELRDGGSGTYGYLLPQDQIEPCSLENYAGLKVACLWAIDRRNRMEDEH